jgi:hypothetical protein
VEVVERAEKQNDVVRPVRGGEAAGVAQFGRHAVNGGCLGDVLGDGVHDVHRVTVVGQPPGVRSGTTADIEHAGRCRREVAAQ